MPHETELAKVTLTAEAASRLGITLAEATETSVQRYRTFGGEVMIPSGKSIIVSAPVAGTVEAPTNQSIPVPGVSVETNAPVLRLEPLLSPERYVPTPAERVQMANARATLMSSLTVAKGDAERARSELDAAQIARNRAQQLLADRAGSRKALDDAQAVYNVAEANLAAADERQHQLTQMLTELDQKDSADAPETILVTAPQAGVVRSLSVTRGQTVTAGTALFEIVDINAVWVRVPVYVGLLTELDAESNARLVDVGGHDTHAGLEAQPVVAPPTADPLSASSDLYYQVDNANGGLRPGQRVSVELPLRGEATGLVVPAKSVLYDIYGGTWVYVVVGETAYQRQRVEVRYYDGDRAVLTTGMTPGTQVVLDGAAELFGTEFGAGK
ncbi:MAG: efflux RND transporter periplasmic adaptor subunit [Planctomycetales bacterium]|nr:efflux RND transporter periplasmic adaptor subunit [Planctomycetales bacterium]